MTSQPIGDLAIAAYCPRKLYYERRGERDPPPGIEARRSIAFRYEALLEDPDRLEEAPIAVDPSTWRTALRGAADRPWWPAIADPVERDAFLRGRRCHGIVHKVLDLDGPVPAAISAGSPPDRGVWEPDAVRAVAMAKALSWEREAGIERAFVEYPAHGVVREIALTTRRKVAYRRALRAAESLDRPPPRLRNRSKCAACEYRDDCGVRTRSLASRLFD